MSASESPTPAAKRGRPRDPDRVRRVLDAAIRQFHENGLERTSMESVAKEAKVSKMTIYSYFPCKGSLFAAALTEVTEQIMDMGGMIQLDPMAPEAMLMAVGEAFLRLLRDEKCVSQHRALFCASAEHQDSREAFYKVGPERVNKQLSAYLKAVDAAGALQIADADMAAEQFLSLFLGTGQYRMLLNLEAPSAAQDACLLKANVALFMKGYGVI